MPELPEVETIVRELREAGLEGKKITRAEIFWARSIATPEADVFAQRIADQSILKVSRRGKYIVISLTQDTLLVHLRMTGKFLFAAQRAPVNSHERVRLWLDDGRLLRYEDQRKFGKWSLMTDARAHLNLLGIEPLSDEFTLKAFQKVLKDHKRQIKPFLLDQHYIAGLGNIYVDEALWEAKIHPTRALSSLTKKEIIALHQAIINVLRLGVKNTGTSLGDQRANYFSVSGRRGGNQHQLNVFRRDGLPCPRCGAIIVKTIVAQRGTHFCPICQ